MRRKKLLDDEVDVAQTHQANGWKEDYNHTTLHASSILRGSQGYWDIGSKNESGLVWRCS